MSKWFETTHALVVAVRPCGLLVRLLQKAFGKRVLSGICVVVADVIAAFLGREDGSEAFPVRPDSLQRVGFWHGRCAALRGPGRRAARLLVVPGAYGCFKAAPFEGKIVLVKSVERQLRPEEVSRIIAMDQKFHAPEMLAGMFLQS